MPNYCMNDFVFYSNDSKSLKDLYNQSKKLFTTNRSDTSFHKLLVMLGQEPLIKQLEDLRHYIIDIGGLEKQGDTYYFHLYTEAAWSPHTEDIDVLLSTPTYQDIQYVYTAEEPGMGIFINSDVNHRFLDTQYLIYYYYGDTTEEDQYFSNKEELVSYLQSKFPNALITPWDSLATMTRKVENLLANAYDSYGFCIHEFESDSLEMSA